MIARHGYLTLSQDRRLIIDPSHHGTDEGIVLSIVGNDLFTDLDSDDISQELIDTLEPQTCFDHWSVIKNATLATHSIGAFLAGTHPYLTGKGDRKKTTIEWVDRLRQQVIRISFRSIRGRVACVTESYIIPTSRGYFVMPIFNATSPQMRCYKLGLTDTTYYLRVLLYYNFPDEDVEMVHRSLIFEDEPFCKNLPIMHDVIVKCAA